jgi:tol-pal system protein YbgF
MSAVSRVLPVLSLVVIAGVLGGCAGVAEVTGTASADDLVQLRADVTQLQLALQRARTESDRQGSGGDARLTDQTTQTRRQVDDIARRLDALSTSVTTLSARVDDLASRLDGLSRRVAPPPAGAAPMPRATAPPPAAPPPGMTTPPMPASPTTPSTTGAAARPTAGSIQAQDVYQAAYIDFSKGSYPLAIAGFREFLRRFPDHELAANAQYWIGEAHFSIARGHANGGQAERAAEELERAVQEFRKVVANYPRGLKAPTALYKEALALVELKQPVLAQARLQYLIENFPQAEETPLARERLAALKSGG